MAPFIKPFAGDLIEPVHKPFMGRSPEVTLPPANGMNSMNDDDTSRWQELNQALVCRPPQSTGGTGARHQHKSRRMAAADGRPDAWQDYKSMAHKVYHAYGGQAQDWMSVGNLERRRRYVSVFSRGADLQFLPAAQRHLTPPPLRQKFRPPDGGILMQGRCACAENQSAEIGVAKRRAIGTPPRPPGN